MNKKGLRITSVEISYNLDSDNINHNSGLGGLFGRSPWGSLWARLVVRGRVNCDLQKHDSASGIQIPQTIVNSQPNTSRK
jgi:hypothetical protein